MNQNILHIGLDVGDAQLLDQPGDDNGPVVVSVGCMVDTVAPPSCCSAFKADQLVHERIIGRQSNASRVTNVQAQQVGRMSGSSSDLSLVGDVKVIPCPPLHDDVAAMRQQISEWQIAPDWGIGKTNAIFT
jgi:hypothetical protein